MLQKERTLTEKTIEVENNFSSALHAIETMVCENTKEKSNLTIPEQYNKNYVRLLPVNTSSYYIYWELSNELLHTHKLDLYKETLTFRIEDLEQNILYQFTSNFALGEFFVNSTFEDSDICVKIGFIRNGKFTKLLQSNVIHTFSTQLHYPTLDNEIWITKEKGWSEILHFTMQHFTNGVSSAQYVKEIEKLKELSKIEEERFSSSTFHKENRDD